MDPEILINANNKAIQGGAVAAPPMDALGQDASWVRTQTDVDIDPSSPAIGARIAPSLISRKCTKQQANR
jgi:hypothetical protein